MKKFITGFAAVMLLLGAGCGGSLAEDTSESASVYATQETEVEQAVDGLVQAALDQDYEEFASFVGVPLEDLEMDIAFGYFLVSQPTIDWSASTWSEDGASVDLVDGEGVALGTWSSGTEGDWTVGSKFWME